MQQGGISRSEALERVRKIRSSVRPNDGFWEQLRTWQLRLEASREAERARMTATIVVAHRKARYQSGRPVPLKMMPSIVPLDDDCITKPLRPEAADPVTELIGVLVRHDWTHMRRALHWSPQRR